MIYHRPAEARGKTSLGWLDSKHTFSFGHYYDPDHMGFSVLRVINDDTVMPGAGFSTHSHQDMEIISYVLEGAIEHKDSIGTHDVIPAGDIQVMSAGSGISHSEFNHSKTAPLKFLQIWIQPNRHALEPSYQQKKVASQGTLTPLVSADGRNQSLTIHQRVNLYLLDLRPEQSASLSFEYGCGYIHLLSGQAKTDSAMLSAADGMGIGDSAFKLQAQDQRLQALVFDLPKINA